MLPPSGKPRESRIKINAGENSQKLIFTPQDIGIIEIRGESPGLIDGANFIRVVGRTPSTSVGDDLTFPIELRYVPERLFKADGRDVATIYALLVGKPQSPLDLEVRLFANGGRLDSDRLIIPKGDDRGKTILTTDHAGTVKVEFRSLELCTICSDTRALNTKNVKGLVKGPKQLNIIFAPAIANLDVKASPRDISLFDEADLVVSLLDGSGKAIRTDQQKEISLALEQGSGKISPNSLTIEKGKFEAHAKFTPTSAGSVQISALTADIVPATVDLNVKWPLLLLILSACGGLVGGVLALWTHKGLSQLRIITGLVTGFVLYWCLVFRVIEVVPRGMVLNPMSAFVFAIIGGWLGTEVFDVLLKRIGLTK